MYVKNNLSTNKNLQCVVQFTYQILPRAGLVAFEGHLCFPSFWNRQFHPFASLVFVEGTW